MPNCARFIRFPWFGLCSRDSDNRIYHGGRQHLAAVQQGARLGRDRHRADGRGVRGSESRFTMTQNGPFLGLDWLLLN